jgi:hypothetical protein
MGILCVHFSPSREYIFLLVSHFPLFWKLFIASCEFTKERKALFHGASRTLIEEPSHQTLTMLCSETDAFEVFWTNAAAEWLVVLLYVGRSWFRPPSLSLLSSGPKLKLRGFSSRANYTDRATAACRRSWCQPLRIEIVSRGQRGGSLQPQCWFSRPEPLLFLSISSPLVLTRLSGPLSRPCSQELWPLDHRGGPPLVLHTDTGTGPQIRSHSLLSTYFLFVIQ